LRGDASQKIPRFDSLLDICYLLNALRLSTYQASSITAITSKLGHLSFQKSSQPFRIVLSAPLF
jgi:hypothetical protein